MAVAAEAGDSVVRLRMGFGQTSVLLFFILLLAWHTGDEVAEGWNGFQSVQRLMIESDFSVKSMAMVQELQRERGLSVGYLANRGRLFAQELAEQRLIANRRIQDLKQQIRLIEEGELFPDVLKDLEGVRLLLEELNQLRKDIDESGCSSVDIVDFFHNLNENAILLLSRMARPSEYSQVTNVSNALLSMAQLKESAGMERAVLNDTFSLNHFRAGFQKKFLQHVFEQPVYEKSFLRFANEEQVDFYQTKMQSSFVDKVKNFRMLAMKGEDQLDVSPKEWYEAATHRIDLLYQVELRLSQDLHQQSLQVRDEALAGLLFHLVFSAGVLSVAGFALILSLVGLHKRYLLAIQGTAKVKSLLVEKDDLLDRLQDVARMGDWTIPIHDSVWQVSRGFRQVLGLPKEVIVNTEVFLNRLVAEDRGRLDNTLHHLLQQGGEAELEYQISTLQGSKKMVYLRMEQKTNGDGLKGVILDITRRKEMEEQLRHLAHHDILTCLPNRVLAHDRLDMAMAAAMRKNSKVAVLCLDLDGFKKVNDRLGHDGGDVLLQEVAQRLQFVVRKMDTVARMGGDEFLLILPDLAEKEDVVPVAGKLLHAIQNSFTICGEMVVVGVSIGISFYPDDGDDIASLLRKADMALYGVKEEGKNNFRFYDITLTMI